LPAAVFEDTLTSINGFNRQGGTQDLLDAHNDKEGDETNALATKPILHKYAWMPLCPNDAT
jgi:hypothetical protein